MAIFLVFEQQGQLARKCGLTGTVKTGHEHNRRVALKLQVDGLTTHQSGEFVVHNLNHELTRLHAGEHILAESLLLDSVGEAFGNFIVDVGVDKRTAHVFKCFGYVDFGDATFTLQYFEGTFKSFAEIFKHTILYRCD